MRCGLPGSRRGLSRRLRACRMTPCGVGVRRFVAGLVAGWLAAAVGGLGAQQESVVPVELVVLEPFTITLPPPRAEVVYGDIDGQEQCLLDVLTARGWDVDLVSVVTVLDEAWGEHDGPCSMLP